MPSGLAALLDDVATIAKVAAASVDDVAAAAGKAGSKAAGVVIDDAAVTPKYVHGFEADRELPIIWRIALGSLKNKLVVLLPGLLALAAFAPWVITPLLMIGGAYLCFEGAEKVFHILFPHGSHEVEADLDPKDPAHLEEEKIAGAIKTDFILSAEIMTIALAAIPDQSFWMEAVTLAVVGTLITVAVYGAVALIVKADDAGMALAANRRPAASLLGLRRLEPGAAGALPAHRSSRRPPGLAPWQCGVRVPMRSFHPPLARRRSPARARWAECGGSPAAARKRREPARPRRTPSRVRRRTARAPRARPASSGIRR